MKNKIISILLILLCFSCNVKNTTNETDEDIIISIDRYIPYLEEFLQKNNFYKKEESISIGVKNFLIAMNEQKYEGIEFPPNNHLCSRFNKNDIFHEVWHLDTTKAKIGDLFSEEGKDITLLEKTFNSNGEYYKYLNNNYKDLEPAVKLLMKRREVWPQYSESHFKMILDNFELDEVKFDDTNLIRFIIIEILFEVFYESCYT